MSFKQPTMRTRRSYFFTDAPSTMRAQPAMRAQRDAVPGAATVGFFRGASGTPDDYENQCEGRDAGRQRLPPMPEHSHYAGGAFSDAPETGQNGYGTPGRHGGFEGPTRPEAEFRGTGTAPEYTGRYESTPNASANRAGRLGTPVVSGPRGDGPVGLSGTAAYDPRTNTTTVGRDATLLGNHTAAGVRGMRPDGMGQRAATPDTADRRRLRRINDANRRFWAHPGDAETQPDGETTPGEIPENPDDDTPSITRYVALKEHPDGSQTIHRHAVEVHPPPPKPQPTNDRLAIYRRPPPAGTYASRPSLDTAGGRHGSAAAAAGVAHRSATAAAVNAMNRRFYGT